MLISYSLAEAHSSQFEWQPSLAQIKQSERLLANLIVNQVNSLTNQPFYPKIDDSSDHKKDLYQSVTGF